MQVLILGPMSMVRIVDVVLHLPSRLQELDLTAKSELEPNGYPGEKSDELFEEAWARYWRQSHGQSQGDEDNDQSSNSGNDNNNNHNNKINGDNDIDNESGQGGQALFPSPTPTARSLLENMSAVARLTRFSLTDVRERRPEWIILEIVCHCPHLMLFRLPLLSGNGNKILAQAIQERQLDRLEHLELSDLQFWIPECATLLDALLPSGSGKGKAQSGVNCLTPEVQTKPKDGAGLRSLTLLHDT